MVGEQCQLVEVPVDDAGGEPPGEESDGADLTDTADADLRLPVRRLEGAPVTVVEL